MRRLDEALARTPLGSVGAADAPYVPAVKAYAMAGRADRARGVMAEWNVRRRTSPTLNDSIFQHAMAGSIALAEREYLVAQRELRAAGQQGCEKCNLPPLGQAYDLGGSPDSAIAVYERFVTHRFLDRLDIDALFVPATHKRLAELYEARGERDKAVKHNRAFIELWKDADPELQPSVTAARQRVAELTRGTDVAREGRR